MPRLPHRRSFILMVSVAITSGIAPAQAFGRLRVEKVASFPAIGGEFGEVAFNGDGTSMVSVGTHCDLIWWDTRRMALRRRYPAPGHYVYRTTHHPTRELVAFGSSRDDRASLKVLDLPSGHVRELMPRLVAGVAFDPAGERMAVVYQDPDARRYCLRIFARLQGWTPRGRGLPPHRDIPLPSGTRMLSPCFAASGRRLYLSDRRVSMRRGPDRLRHLAIDLTSPQPRPRPGSGAVLGRDRGGGVVRMLQPRYLVMDGRSVEVGNRRMLVAAAGHVARMPWQQPQHFDRLDRNHQWQKVEVPGCSFLRLIWAAPDGTVAVADARSQLHVFRGSKHHVLGGHRGRVVQLGFTPDSRYVAATGESGLRVADLEGRVVQDFLGGHGADRGPAGPELVIAGRKGAVLWNASLGRVVRRLASWPASFRPSFYLGLHRRLVPGPTAMVALPDSSRLLFRRSEMKRYRREVAFDLARARLQKLHDGNDPRADWRRDAVQLVASPTGRHFAVLERTFPSSCGMVYLGMRHFGGLRLHTADGMLQEYEVLEEAPRTACFSPDGRWLFVGGGDKSIRLLSTKDFTADSRKKLQTGLLWAAFLDEEILLAHDATRLLVLSLPDLVVRQRIELPGTGNLAEAPRTWTPPDTDTRHIECLALSPDRRHLAVGCSRVVLLYRLAWSRD